MIDWEDIGALEVVKRTNTRQWKMGGLCPDSIGFMNVGVPFCSFRASVAIVFACEAPYRSKRLTVDADSCMVIARLVACRL